MAAVCRIALRVHLCPSPISNSRSLSRFHNAPRLFASSFNSPLEPSGRLAEGPAAAQRMSASALEQTPVDDLPSSCVGSPQHAASSDHLFMREALQEARAAAARGEVPVGAVLVRDGRVLARGHNLCEALSDPTAHAELLCIRNACTAAGQWRHLATATLFVTLEPCPMCAGAVLQSRLAAVVWGARNPLLGADGSWVALLPVGGGGGGAGGKGEGEGERREREAEEQEREGRRIASPNVEGGSEERRADGMAAPQQSLDPPPEHSGGLVSIGTGGVRGGGRGPSASADSAAAAAPAPGDAGGHGAAAAGSVCSPRHPFHPSLEVRRGVLAEECAEVMREFFRRRRREGSRWRSKGGAEEAAQSSVLHG